MTQQITLTEDQAILTLPNDVQLEAAPVEPETQPAEAIERPRPNAIEFYLDFLCPFSYRAMLWLSEVRSVLDDDPTDDYLPIKIAYHYFSLEQYSRETDAATKEQFPVDIWAANADLALRYGADGYIWQPPRVEETRNDAELEPPHTGTPPTFKGLLPFIAGEAARRQGMRSGDPLGERSFEAFYKALGALRHEDGLIIWDRDVIELAAEKAALDTERFQRDLEDPEVINAGVERIRRDHTRAKEYYGATDTPTLIIGDDEPRPMALKLMPNPTGAQALALYTHIFNIVTRDQTFFELRILQTAADKARLALMTERSQRGLDWV